MDEITLENFRCFREKQIARLAPLTLLVGENSTGKTSFMAMIRALWDVAYRHRVPNFKEEPYDLGSFDEIAHHRGAKGGRAKEIGAGFKTTLTAFPRQGRRADAVPYCFSVTFNKKGIAPIPVTLRFGGEDVRMEIRQDQDRTRLSIATPNGSWELPNTHFIVRLLTTDSDRMPDPSLLMHLMVTGDRNDGTTPIPSGNSGPLTDYDLEQIEQFAFRHGFPGSHEDKRPHASAPVRSKPRRTYDPARPARDPEGDYVPMYLASEYFQNKKTWTSLKNSLEHFGQSAGLFDEISIKALGKKGSEPFQVQIRKFSGNLKGPPRNLIDTGYGVSQVLPVITELLRDDAPPMFLLQQPEVHLHPSAQAALGSLFCKVASPTRQLVVETHSDHLLDRVRMDVRDGKAPLKPDDVSILFFERGALDVHIHSLRLDKNGNVGDAPESYRKFFMEETTRSLGL